MKFNEKLNWIFDVVRAILVIAFYTYLMILSICSNLHIVLTIITAICVIIGLVWLISLLHSGYKYIKLNRYSNNVCIEENTENEH